MVALVAMMLVTIVDVGMRLLVNELVLGSVEIVQLMLVFAVFLALPETFERNEQITVDIVDQALKPRPVTRLRQAAALVTVVVLLALAWRTVPPALDTLEFGDLTSDLKISLFWYWLPIVIGCVAAAVAAVVGCLVEFRAATERDGPA